MDNLHIWKKLCTVPGWALKKIQAGRLKGKSDINPQWRYEALTEQFGPIGTGWKYTIEKLWTEQANDGIVLCFATVMLSVKMDGDKWDSGTPGIGGNQLVQKESAGLHANDEGYKMAVTDALSVAAKMYGVGADIYKGLSDSKYSNPPQNPPKKPDKPWLNESMPAFKKAKNQIASGEKTINDVRNVYAVSKKIAALLLENITEPPPNCEQEKDVPF